MIHWSLRKSSYLRNAEGSCVILVLWHGSLLTKWNCFIDMFYDMRMVKVSSSGVQVALCKFAFD